VRSGSVKRVGGAIGEGAAAVAMIHIDVYSWPTPNGHKVHIMLEECGLPYRAIPSTSAPATSSSPTSWRSARTTRSRPWSTRPAPDGKPISLFESGAILVYLASKTGRFLPQGDREKFEVLQWLMFQMGGVGPMLGQAHHFRMYAPEKLQYAIDRYTNEAKRLYGVIDKRLAGKPVAGWQGILHRRHRHLPLAAQLAEPGHRARRVPAPEALVRQIAARPAVQRGVKVLADLRKPITDDKAREILFGKHAVRDSCRLEVQRGVGFSLHPIDPDG
jgi:GST-like protein